MWRNFKLFIFFSISVLAGFNNLSAQNVIHNLEPEWVYYDEDAQGFLPAVLQSGQGRTISFPLAVDDYSQFYLRIGLKDSAYLFHGNQLLSRISPGTTYFKIDSLDRFLTGVNPLLTIYGKNISRDLSTAIVNNMDSPVAFTEARVLNGQFRNFFVLVGVFLLMVLVILRSMFPDVFGQYTDLLRLVDLKTMDELIYKLRFFSPPNIYFIVFISMTIGWSMIAFNERHPAIISPGLIDLAGDTMKSYLLEWLKLSALIMLIFLAKYFLLYLFSKLFAFNTLSVHFASYLRLVFWASLIFGVLIIIDEYFLVPFLVHVIYIGTLVFTFLRITLVFLRLMRLESHTVLHLLLYLCATELIPFVFIYKVVIG